MKSLSHVRLFVNPMHQAPPSMGFSRQEYQSGVPFPSPGDIPDPGIEPRSPHLAGRRFTLWATREASRRVKTPLNEECKETEGNNSIRKTRDLFRKTGDIQGTFHAKMDTIKDTNRMYLTEAEDIKKKRQENTELCKKKILMTWITMMVWSLT